MVFSLLLVLFYYQNQKLLVQMNKYCMPVKLCSSGLTGAVWSWTWAHCRYFCWRWIKWHNSAVLWRQLLVEKNQNLMRCQYYLEDCCWTVKSISLIFIFLNAARVLYVVFYKEFLYKQIPHGHTSKSWTIICS